MRIAITGGTGFLGIPLVRKLLHDGHAVSLLREKGNAIFDGESLPIRIVEGDINDARALAELVKDADLMFHLAGKVHDPYGKPEDFMRVNVEGTRRVVDSAIENKVRKIVFYSTIMVYGRISNAGDNETSECEPRDHYGASKLKAEEIVLNAAKNGMCDAVVLRLPVVYGPFDKGNIRRLIKAVSQKLFVYFGDGKAKRTMIYSGNVVEAACVAGDRDCGKGGVVYCIADGNDYTIVELVETICDVLGIDWRPLHVPQCVADLAGRCGDALKPVLGRRVSIDSDQVKKLSSSLTFSCGKIKRELGYAPKIGLKEGIRAEIEWMRREGLL